MSTDMFAGQSVTSRHNGAGSGRPVEMPARLSDDPALVPAAAGVSSGRQAPRRERRRLRERVFPAWPLLLVLAVQAALSLRLVRADTAYVGEAAALNAGHLEWAHWLHGIAIPPFASYYSGAPVIYPPIAAAADSLGGLAGARVLSLVFMLGATVLLWGTGARLFGRRASFFAAALFAVLAPTLHLGAFATYDAMSLFLMALAAWCAVRAGTGKAATGWMIAAGIALAVGNAAAYSSILFDLFVAAVAVLAAVPSSGLGRAASRAALMLIVAAGLLGAGWQLGGSSYSTGFEATTLARAPASATPLSVLASSWSWAGLLILLAVGGVVISLVSRQPAARTCLLAVLTAAAVAGPVEQARLHTQAALNEHVGLGAWFAALAAGYAVDRFIAAASPGRVRAVTCGACLTALIFPVALGAAQSRKLAASWPNASSFVTVFRPLADHDSGHLLVEDPAIAEYYLPSGRHWQRWSSTRNILLPSGISTGGSPATASAALAGNPGVYAEYITAGYFSLVALNFGDTTALDYKIAADLRRNHHYHIVAVIPYGIEVPPIGVGTYVVWRYERSTHQQSGYTPSQ